MRVSSLLLLSIVILLHSFENCFGFLNQRPSFRSSPNRHSSNNNNDDGKGPPKSPRWSSRSSGDSDGGLNGDDAMIFASSSKEQTWHGMNETLTDNDSSLAATSSFSKSSKMVRGGGGGVKKASKEVVKGTQVSMGKVANFWKSSVTSTKKKVSKMFQSKESKEEEELMQKLSTMPVKAVTIPGETVLPQEVVRIAVKRSGLIGNPLRTDRVQEIARSLKRWYMSRGYILHSVTGATLNADTATAQITVQEPKVSNIPVDITVCKQMVVDTDGEVMTFKQYRAKLAERKAFRYDRIDPKDLNTTYVETTGRTKATRVAKALNMAPGKSFCWDGDRWRKVSSSGVFSKVLQVGPQGMPNGTVQLQVIAVEPPPRHLEYGLAKSLYTGSWEGEIDFENKNLFGGGESVGVTVRRGTKDAEPSIRVSFSDDKFGLEGGYNVDVFSEFIGNTEVSDNSENDGGGGSAERDYDNDALLDRRGATFRLRNPFNPNRIQNSVASASVERTSTRNGLHESIGSASMTIGPFRRSLPMDARTDIASTVTSGSRFAISENEDTSTSLRNIKLLPYSSISATTRQILPLSSLTPSSSDETGRPPLILALQHTIATSTHNLPRHEANAMSIASQIRGASPDGRTSTSVKGTTELRVPFTLPFVGSASTILFGDWFFCQRTDRSPFYSKSSIGIGLRKNVQGLPLKYDVCYSSEGKIKTMFGLGPDFDV